jgi:hypothetical protein
MTGIVYVMMPVIRHRVARKRVQQRRPIDQVG